jgi:CheY-like chemotaxis protein
MTETHHHTHSILIVDDNADVRDATVMLLRASGFEAGGAENGQEALARLRGGFKACLIVLDMNLPVMDGWTFRNEQMRDAQLSSIPLVVLSAAVNPMTEGKRLGAAAALHKPIEVDMLLSLASKHCPRRLP